jgi:uncharacterized protein involved in exopolysaccharide biosynthesis
MIVIRDAVVDVARASGLDNLGRLRDVKYYEFLYELLAKQYELAKIDEAKDSTVIQILDKGMAPDRRSRPKRTLIVLSAALVALLGAVIWAFAREATSRAETNPAQSPRLRALRGYLRWK